jgi:hypothetical protein
MEQTFNGKKYKFFWNGIFSNKIKLLLLQERAGVR